MASIFEIEILTSPSRVRIFGSNHEGAPYNLTHYVQASEADRLLVEAYAEDKKQELAKAYSVYKIAGYTHYDGVVFKGGDDAADKLHKTYQIDQKFDGINVTFLDINGDKVKYTLAEGWEMLALIAKKARDDKFAYVDMIKNIDTIVNDGLLTPAEKVTAIQAV